MNFQFRRRAIPFYVAAAITASSCSSHQTTNEVKAGVEADTSIISALTPNATAIRLEKHGDLDLDGDSDVIVVLEKPDDAQAKQEPRPLLIFLRNKSGKLEKVVESLGAILCQSCGGMMGDPLQGINIDPGAFTLVFEGGSRELWQREYSFAYSPGARAWLLNQARHKVLDRVKGDSEQSLVAIPDTARVSIEEFDPSEFLEDTNP